MSFIVEDGTGLEDANALISTEYFYETADSRNVNTGGFTTSQIEGAIVVASQDYISNYYSFKGELLNEDQGLALPTDEVIIGSKVKRAAYEAALLQLNGNLFVDPNSINSNGQITMEAKSLVTGMDTEVEYAENTQYTTSYPTPTVDRLLQNYLSPTGGSAPASSFRY